MPSSLQSPADIVNAALAQIGYKDRVANLYEGSKAAKNALDIYGQTRDQLLRMGDWSFAQREVTGTLIKSAPIGGYVPPIVWTELLYPPLPWQYEYMYLSDCIKVRAVKPTLILIPNFNPQPYLFRVANDSGQRVILSNVPNAVITYVGQITNPTDMPPDFLEAFVSSLGRRLAPLLSTMDATKLEAQAEQIETQIAEHEQG
jgi:hypothetical protein